MREAVMTFIIRGVSTVMTVSRTLPAESRGLAAAHADVVFDSLVILACENGQVSLRHACENGQVSLRHRNAETGKSERRSLTGVDVLGLNLQQVLRKSHSLDLAQEPFDLRICDLGVCDRRHVPQSREANDSDSRQHRNELSGDGVR